MLTKLPEESVNPDKAKSLESDSVSLEEYGEAAEKKFESLMSNQSQVGVKAKSYQGASVYFEYDDDAAFGQDDFPLENELAEEGEQQGIESGMTDELFEEKVEEADSESGLETFDIELKEEGQEFTVTLEELPEMLLTQEGEGGAEAGEESFQSASSSAGADKQAKVNVESSADLFMESMSDSVVEPDDAEGSDGDEFFIKRDQQDRDQGQQKKGDASSTDTVDTQGEAAVEGEPESASEPYDSGEAGSGLEFEVLDGLPEYSMLDADVAEFSEAALRSASSAAGADKQAHVGVGTLSGNLVNDQEGGLGDEQEPDSPSEEPSFSASLGSASRTAAKQTVSSSPFEGSTSSEEGGGGDYKETRTTGSQSSAAASAGALKQSKSNIEIGGKQAFNVIESQFAPSRGESLADSAPPEGSFASTEGQRNFDGPSDHDFQPNTRGFSTSFDSVERDVGSEQDASQLELRAVDVDPAVLEVGESEEQDSVEKQDSAEQHDSIEQQEQLQESEVQYVDPEQEVQQPELEEQATLLEYQGVQTGDLSKDEQEGQSQEPLPEQEELNGDLISESSIDYLSSILEAAQSERERLLKVGMDKPSVFDAVGDEGGGVFFDELSDVDGQNEIVPEKIPLEQTVSDEVGESERELHLDHPVLDADQSRSAAEAPPAEPVFFEEAPLVDGESAGDGGDGAQEQAQSLAHLEMLQQGDEVDIPVELLRQLDQLSKTKGSLSSEFAIGILDDRYMLNGTLGQVVLSNVIAPQGAGLKSASELFLDQYFHQLSSHVELSCYKTSGSGAQTLESMQFTFTGKGLLENTQIQTYFHNNAFFVSIAASTESGRLYLAGNLSILQQHLSSIFTDKNVKIKLELMDSEDGESLSSEGVSSEHPHVASISSKRE